MTDSIQDQKANLTPEQKIRDILAAYKRYPYGTKELPHITGDEAVQQLLALFLEEKIKELELFYEYWHNGKDTRNTATYRTDRLQALKQESKK